MKASELVYALNTIIHHHGDLPIVGGYLSDDSPLRKVELVDDKGRDAETGIKPTGIFLTQ